MKALNDNYHVSATEGFVDGGYFPVEEAIRKITYSQDKSLVSLSHKNIRSCRWQFRDICSLHIKP